MTGHDRPVTDEGGTDADGSGANAAGAGDHQRTEVARESVTMALYVSVSVLAVLLALPADRGEGHGREWLTVLGAGIGLVLAHHVAFRLSTRLVSGGLLTPESVRLLKAQALGGLPIAVVAALPVLVLGPDPGVTVSEVLLLGLVALVGYRSVRASSSRARALGYVVGLVLSVGAVIGFKLLVGH